MRCIQPCVRFLVLWVNLRLPAKKLGATISSSINGRLNKYFQENTLMEQEYIMEAKVKVKDFIAKADKDLKCTGFKRLELGA